MKNELKENYTNENIAKRKGLRYREDILDNMGSEELAANLFRNTQTESRLKEDNICSEKRRIKLLLPQWLSLSCQIHHPNTSATF